MAKTRARRWLPIAATVFLAAVAVAVGVHRAENGNSERDPTAFIARIAPAARGRTVVTNSAAFAYYLRDLHPHLDRPFGLGPGLPGGCVASCKAGFLTFDDPHVAGARGVQAIGPSLVDQRGQMSSLACSIALLIASSLGGIGTPHPMEVTVQDDALFLHQQPAAVQRTAKRLAALGADRIRITAGWSVLEPKRNQYSASGLRSLDTAVKAATAAKLKVQIDLAFWAPSWAVARRLAGSDATRQRWRPDPVAFGQFAQVIARRYNGGKLPAVRLWTTWNEPNHPTFLLPQSERTSNGRWRDVAPQIYRAMHEAAYGALKNVNPQNQVLIGGLSSRGAHHPGPDRNIPPLRFIRDMACVDARLRPLDDPACKDFHPLQADGFSYHPYSFEAPPNVAYGGPDTVHLADLNRLSDLLARLHAMGRITTDLPLYLTEFGYESNPPDHRRGVPPETQARYMSLGAFLAWRNPTTRMFAQFLFQDIADPHSYQTGLLYPDGQSKPALQAFKLPFWAQAQETNGQTYVLIWGQVRPGSGSQPVSLEAQRPDGTWHELPSFPAGNNPDGRNCPTEDQQFLTDENGFYERLVPYQGVDAYRARWTRPDGGSDYALPVTVGLPVPS